MPRVLEKRQQLKYCLKTHKSHQKTGKRWLFDEEKRLVREEGFLKWLAAQQAKHHEVRKPWHHRATLMEYTVVFVQSTHLSGGIPDSRIVERCEDIMNMSCKLLYSSLF